ncbi:hypothetical protein [Afipia massiliensis]|nr:hypothetical protein [Afipia massiliensis]
MAERKWLFENRIWNDEVMHTSATPTIVITGLVPAIHDFSSLK